jgi:hypothetical protein
VQAELLREQNLLRCFQKKHGTPFASALQKWRSKSAAGNRICFRPNYRFDARSNFRSASRRERTTTRPFAASSGDDLHPTHLIQKA